MSRQYTTRHSACQNSPDILIFFTLLFVLLSTSTLIAIDSPW